MHPFRGFRPAFEATGEGFLFEPKWDGYRAIVFRGKSDVFIQSRDLRPLDRYFPELARGVPASVKKEDRMRTVVTALFGLALTVPGLAQTPAASGADDVAIRRVVQQQDDARNRGDWKAFGELFTQDAEQLTSAGEWRRGRDEIEKGVAQTMAVAGRRAVAGGGSGNGRYVDVPPLMFPIVPIVSPRQARSQRSEARSLNCAVSCGTPNGLVTRQPARLL